MKSSDKYVWLDEQRNGRSANRLRADQGPFFGYETVSEADKAGRVLKHFDSVAHRYDFMNTLLSFGIHYIWKYTAVRLTDLKPGDRVLDVCGGTGDLARLASKRVGSSGRVTVYDFNWDMMAAGRPKSARSPHGRRIGYVQGDAERIALADNSVDAAMVGFGIRNLTHLEEGFREMHRVLKPGGKMMCLEFSKPSAPLFRWLYDLYSFHVMPWLGEVLVGTRAAYTHLPESIRTFPLPDELSAILRGIGFVNVTYRRLTNGIAVIHVGRKG